MSTTGLDQFNSDERYVDVLTTENGLDVPVNVIAYNQPITTDSYGVKYVSFLDHTALDFIGAQIREMITDKFDCVLMITGRRRIGKSNLGLQIARKVDPSFSVEQVAFHVDDFARLIDKNPSADPANGVFPQAFYDEAGFGLFSKDWMQSWVKEVGKCLQVVGKKQNIVYFILPHIKKLVGDIRDEMAYIWIDVDFGYKHERGYAEVYMGDRNKHKQMIWWNPKCCFKYNELADDFWMEYERRKDVFIAEVASGKHDTSSRTKDAERFNKAVYELTRVGLSPAEIAERLEIGQATVYRRLAEAKSRTEPGPI